MSKKRKNRNNKKVLQALRQKRAAGGRLNKRNGGPSEEDIQRMIAEQAAQARQQQEPVPVHRPPDHVRYEGQPQIRQRQGQAGRGPAQPAGPGARDGSARGAGGLRGGEP